MASPPTAEGEIGFAAPNAGKPCKTWYKVIGTLDSTSGLPPLVILHGGPGAGHEYMSSLLDLYAKYSIPLVFYDQVGCGRSTHFREKMGDESFWTFELFYAELDNLVDHLGLRSERGFYLLGHSWGGVLAGAYACRRPKGLKKLIISSGPASVPLYVEGCQKLLAAMPEDVRKTLEECEKRGDYESEEYEKASAVFYGRHVCRLYPYPDDVMMAFTRLKEDPTAYLTIQGPSEFSITGHLKTWEGWQEGHKIQVETLILNGRYDEVTDLSIEPWLKTISRVRWITLENSSHMAHYEERERYMEICGNFLTSKSP